MKIYTKTGDRGETGLFGGRRVQKDDLRIQAYGTLDELNAVLGLVIEEARAGTQAGDLRTLELRLTRLQNELFQLGSELATPAEKKTKIALVGGTETQTLEQEIDLMEAELKPLTNFILPGGSRLSGLLHLARTVSRRAEREVVTLGHHEKLRTEVLEYVNRLSDYLFVCARFANHLVKVADVPWVAKV